VGKVKRKNDQRQKELCSHSWVPVKQSWEYPRTIEYGTLDCGKTIHQLASSSKVFTFMYFMISSSTLP
jgi:hypothetical protein